MALEEGGRGRARRPNLPVILMAAGLVLLLYVGFQYARMYFEQRRLVQQWEQQQRRQAARTGSASRRVADGLTRLSIPKINLSAIVIEGTTRHDLLLGPGHIPSTAKPGDGGNAVITGHRDTFFRHIYELNKGDLISIQRDGTTFLYEVTGKRVVKPEDVSVLKPTSDSRLTLITCYPTYYVGPAPKRLVVFSRLRKPLEPQWGPTAEQTASMEKAAAAK